MAVIHDVHNWTWPGVQRNTRDTMRLIGDNDEIFATFLAKYDFVLTMVDGDVCRDFVARVIEESGIGSMSFN